MKLPRDLSGYDLIKGLKKFGYTITRKTGSHIRLSTSINGEHHITVPAHDFLRIGTLASILTAVAGHFNISKEEVLTKIAK
ncbi:MAG: hypothetical protein A3I05_02305 [Deltaproteobacteria bacterium RIFCSPLOWO2_02_FULL_44_10]|nr:MAG: hypothetical protein A3I05_02305 [Deltaproteobacteria bacterium RIFCSPLOWO2_02_FULL_44_10]